jgi:tRNA uridine 5-carboxymethylaminomethyl modification enzyme
MADLDTVRDYANSVSVTPTEANRYGLSLNRDGQRRTAFEILSYPDATVDDLARIWPKFHEFASDILRQVEIDAKYAVYLDRQAADIDAYRRDESLLLPHDLDYDTVAGLSNECRQKLALVRPHTLGQASRLDGMTPAALTVLAAHVRRQIRAVGLG